MRSCVAAVDGRRWGQRRRPWSRSASILNSSRRCEPVLREKAERTPRSSARLSASISKRADQTGHGTLHLHREQRELLDREDAPGTRARWRTRREWLGRQCEHICRNVDRVPARGECAATRACLLRYDDGGPPENEQCASDRVPSEPERGSKLAHGHVGDEAVGRLACLGEGGPQHRPRRRARCFDAGLMRRAQARLGRSVARSRGAPCSAERNHASGVHQPDESVQRGPRRFEPSRMTGRPSRSSWPGRAGRARRRASGRSEGAGRPRRR